MSLIGHGKSFRVRMSGAVLEFDLGGGAKCDTPCSLLLFAESTRDNPQSYLGMLSSLFGQFLQEVPS